MKNNLKVLGFAMTAALVLSACAGAATPAPTAKPAATAVPATAAPTAKPAEPTKPTEPTKPAATAAPAVETIKIYSSHPLQGASKGSSDAINNGYKLAFEQLTKEGTVCNGKFKIAFEALDDSTAAKGSWDGPTEQGNATKAAADKDAMVYFGTTNSGAAKVSIPILAAANMAMISPANTYDGLTKAAEPGEPDKYYPNGAKRNYMRVVPSDGFQGVVDANWIKGLGAKSVYVVDDTELYGKGVADVLEKQAKTIGLEVKGRQGVTAKDMQAQANSIAVKILGTKPDAVFYGGVTASNGPMLLVELKKAGYKGIFLGPDGVQEAEFVNAAGKTADGKFVAEGVYATIGSISVADLPASGQKFLTDFSAKYGVDKDKIEVYSKYAYAVAQVALNAIGKVCAKDRAAIRDAMMATKDLDTVVGKMTFDANGDTTSTTMTGYVVDAKGNWVETPIKQAP
ncbi:MAG: branched-chain amino acid ABC transporter substrate-binding protein [Thermoflexales bacterium]|nr:branched-chain amino acid ABC transporter substrate-binding protein [Thermoflexales bacterium]